MHHGIAAYFEAGGLGHTPMNLHSPTERPREREKPGACVRLRCPEAER